MANKVKFELNREGVAELLVSPAMHKVIDNAAQTVYNRLPSSGYGLQTGSTAGGRIGARAKATVGTRGIKGTLDNSKNNTLLKALGGGA